MATATEIRRDLEKYAEQLVFAADIANRYGISEARVTNWKRRHDDYPVPVFSRSMRNIWILSEIEDWVSAKGIFCENGHDLKRRSSCSTCNYYKAIRRESVI
jgi:hypothetical protein|tara:strand:- start:571 stop:876 length:306 start_codon:yes stop_codon:yes gene_type:complete